MNEYQEVLARILFAVFTGSIIGWERKIRGKPVGIITNTLVCVGATILSIYQQLSFSGIEIYGFSLTSVTFLPGGNNGRIVAQIISGIGFLGAGTIMRDRNSDAVSGITTAATLWIMACLGIIIGSGYWFLSGTSVFTIIFILFFVKGFVNRVLDHKKLVKIYITCERDFDLYAIFHSFGLKLTQNKILKINNSGHILVKTVQLKIFVPSYINIEKTMEEISKKVDIESYKIV